MVSHKSMAQYIIIKKTRVLICVFVINGCKMRIVDLNTLKSIF